MKELSLDRSKPFDIVYGVPGVGFWQNGRSFKPNGEQVDTVRKLVTTDSGENGYVEMSADMFKEQEAKKEPVEEEPEEEPTKTVVGRPEVPDFVKDAPIEPKYPSTMSVDECIYELRSKGIKFPEDARRDKLRELVKKNR